MRSLNILILCSLVTYIQGKTVKHVKHIEHPPSPNEPTKKPVKPVDVIKPPVSPSQQLDLAFVLDTTGSMSSYINSARENIRDIVETIMADSKRGDSQTDVRLALIEYRDHPKEERTFVTRTHDFTKTDHINTMKTWLNDAKARGGGDGPEAVAEALNKTAMLSWRQDSAKIGVLISDAPPHGLVPDEDHSYKQGSPNGHDPMEIVRDLAQKGVTLYVIGCEPAIVPYKDFFMAIAYKAGGQYIPLAGSRLLRNAIIGGAEEELSLQKFQNDVQHAFDSAAAGGRSVDKKKITADLFRKFSASGAKAKQLVINNKKLEGPTKTAKLMAVAPSLEKVAAIQKKIAPKSRPFAGISRFSKFRSSSPVRSFGGRIGLSGRRFRPVSGISSLSSKLGHSPSFAALDSVPLSSGRVSFSKSSRSDKISTKEKGITVEQVDRLVQKISSKFAAI